MHELELTEEEAQTMLFALKVVKHFVPKEYNTECKDLYDKFRGLVGSTIKFEPIKYEHKI